MDKVSITEHSQRLVTGFDLNHILGLWRIQRDNIRHSLHAVKTPPKFSSTEEELKKLCEQLMDYVSAGHFEIYQKLISEDGHFDEDNLALLESLLKQIDKCTDQAIDFNDKYDCDDKFIAAEENSLADDLENLEHCLKIRYVLEEQVVELLHAS